MTMACDNVYTGSALIVPYAHGLIVTWGQNPRKLVVEVGGSNIVNVTSESE